MKRFAALLSIAALVFSFSGTPLQVSAESLTPISEIEAGDLIRGETFSAVYYMGQDGFRYVFPNSKAYFTWYDNFDNVKWISDEDLGSVQIGGNVTYKPGKKMVKINSDPKTYAVAEDGTLRWVSTEEVAISLYGSDWNTKIDDIPDAFFGNYTIGDPIEVAGDYNPNDQMASATDINTDKDLKSPVIVQIQGDGYMPESITVSTDRPVRFLNNTDSKHTATADDLSWGTGTISPNGGHFSRYFKEAGEYTYFDSYNPDTFVGTVIAE